MKKIILSYHSILDLETDVYAKMLKYSKDKKDILKKKDMKSLETLLRKEEALVKKAQKIEKKRVSFHKQNFSAKGSRESFMESLPRGERSLIKKKTEQLKKILDLLNRTNDINATLISQSIDFFKYTLHVLTQVRNKTHAYDSSGQTHSKQRVVESAIFDRKY